MMKEKTMLETWPEDELESVPNCPICGNHHRSLIYEGLADRVHYCAPGVWSFYQCHQCGTAYLDPRPDPASIWRAYTSYFTHRPSMEEAGVVSLNVPQRLRRALRNGYINSRYGLSLRPATSIGAWVVPMLPGKKRGIDHSFRSLPRLWEGQSRSVLDIGCGSGEFLRDAAQIGWDTTGLDPDPLAAALKSGLNVKQGGLPETALPSETYDAVTLSHVIEHLHDPVACLREVFRLCKPGGQVWIATPNLESYGHRRFRKHWIGLQPPNHLVLFTRASITRALNAAGFEHPRFATPHPQAVWYFDASWRVAQDEKQFDAEGCPLPFSLRMRAMLADLKAVLSPRRWEQIVVTARKSIGSG